MAIDWEKAMSSSGTKKKKNNIDWEKAGAYTDKELNAFSQKKSVADSKISAAQNSNTNAFKSMTPSKAMKAPTEAEAMEWVTSRDYYFGTSKVTSTSNSPASQLRLDAKYKQPTTTTSKTPSANIPQTDKGKTNIENTIALIDENEKNGVSTKHLTRDERNQKAW